MLRDFIQNTYHPFGMVLAGRRFSGSSYRYGFNGKENDNEVKGEGNQYDYGFRIYDPRLGRFLSVDPLTASYPWNSTYAFAENDVMRSIDLDGLEKKVVIHWIDKIHDDGALHISKTSVSIDQSAKFDGWGQPSVKSKASGSVFALTETYYYMMGENKLYKGKDLLENANVNSVNPPPSAQYSYVKDDINRDNDDYKWAGFNPLKWGRLTGRDLDAPDNAMNVEDVSMAMLAFTSVVGAPLQVRVMLKVEGIAVDGVNAGATTNAAVRVGTGSILRKVDFFGGIKHALNKHLTGNGPLSLKTLDPGGTLEKWGNYITNIAQTGNGVVRAVKGGEVLEVMGQMEKAGGGTLNIGAKLFKATGEDKWELTTILTKQ